MNSEQMYAEIILDYYRNPKNKGNLENPNIKARDINPMCGDIIEINANLNNNHIKEIRFNGKGCVISQASASLLTESVLNKDIKYLKNISKEDVLEILGIPISPMRLKCALLPLKVLKLGLYKYLGEKFEENGYEE